MGKERKIDRERANEILGKWAEEHADVRHSVKYGTPASGQYLFSQDSGQIAAHGQAGMFRFYEARPRPGSDFSRIDTKDFREFVVVRRDDGETEVILRKLKHSPNVEFELTIFKVNEHDKGEKKLVLPENPTIQ